MFARSICAVLACGLASPAVAHRIVFLAEQDHVYVRELFIVDTNRPGETLKLNKPMPWFAEGVNWFAISPDGSKIVFSADRQFGDDRDLCLVDLATTGTVIRLGDLPPGWMEGFPKFSPDGNKIAFTATDDAYGPPQLYLVDLATPGSATRMNGQLATDGAVSLSGFDFTPDGSHLVYTAGELEKKYELYAVALDRPRQSIRLNAPGGGVGDSWEGRFRVLPDSRHVVYSAVWQHSGQREVHIVAFDGPGQPMTLNAALPVGGYVHEFAVSPNGGHVAYIADAEKDDVREAYLVPTNAPGAAIKVSPAVQDGAGLLQFTADGQYLVLVADGVTTDPQRDLYMVPVDGRFAAIPVSAPRDAGTDVGPYSLSTDGRQMVYPVYAQDGFARDLLVARLDAPGQAMKLNGPLPDGTVESFPAPQFSPDGTEVAFIAVESVDSSIQELFVASLSAPGTSVRVNGPLAPGGIVTPVPYAFAFLPAGAPSTAGAVAPPAADSTRPSSGGGAVAWPSLLLLFAAVCLGRTTPVPVRTLLPFSHHGSNSVCNAEAAAYLPMRQADYLQLLDVGGRIAVLGKRGRIDHRLKPILDRRGLSIGEWIETILAFRPHYRNGDPPPFTAQNSLAVGFFEQGIAPGSRLRCTPVQSISHKFRRYSPGASRNSASMTVMAERPRDSIASRKGTIVRLVDVQWFSVGFTRAWLRTRSTAARNSSASCRVEQVRDIDSTPSMASWQPSHSSPRMAWGTSSRRIRRYSGRSLRLSATLRP